MLARRTIELFSVTPFGYVLGMDLFGVSDQRAGQVLRDGEAEIARIRYRQAEVLNRLWLDRVARGNGARSAKEWVAATADVAPETAAQLVQVSEKLQQQPRVRNALEAGEISFDRAAELFKQPLSTADPDESARWDIVGLRRLAAQQRRLTRHHERDVFAHRYVAVQPSLDESQWDIHGRLAGVDGRLVEKALQDRGDGFGDMPDGASLSRGQRNADALVAMAQDSLDRSGDSEVSSGAQVSVFIDIDVANGSGGEAGVEVEYGTRVGPKVLEELLCTGSVQIIGLQAGRPVVTSDGAKAIPPAIRKFVALRDGGCTADGCTSRYRLQPHHIRQQSDGGDHDPYNLTTLCWFHHHVVVHGMGFRIDAESPPGRIRFTRTRPQRGPPL